MVKAAIRGRIVRWEYEAGMRLPSENDFVREFKVGRHTVLKALSELVIEGVITRQQGRGTFATAPDVALKGQVAVIVYHSDNQYYSGVIRGIERKLSESRFRLFLANSENSEQKETEHIERLIGSVDAFILCPVTRARRYSDGIRRILDSRIPLTFVADVLIDDPLSALASYVLPDDCTGAFLAGTHLVDCGYRRFKFLIPDRVLNTDVGRERLRGFKFALARHGMRFVEGDVVVETSSHDSFNGFDDDGFNVGKAIDLGGEPLGVFACGDQLAIGFMRALRERGVKVPEDVGICGFDDIGLARQWGIDLTTIAQERIEMGERAAEITLARVKNPAAAVEHVITSVTLVVRSTTARRQI